MSTDTAFALGMLALVGSGLPGPGAHLPAHRSPSSTIVAGWPSSRSSTAAHLAAARAGWRGWASCCVVLAVRRWPCGPRPGLPAARGGGLGGVLQVRRRPGRGRPGHGPAHLRLPRRAQRPGAGHATCSGCSASSPPRSWPARRAAACGWRSRPTSGCSSCSTPGRATSSCRCSPWPTPAITVSGGFSGPRLHLAGHARASCSATWWASRSAPSAPRGSSPSSAAGRIRPPVGWAAVTGAGARSPGIGFTVSLLIASLAFRGSQLAEAKLGILSAAFVRLGAHLGGLPAHRAAARSGCSVRALLGTADTDHRPGRARSTPSATTSAARTRRRSRWSSTATSSAPTAARPSRWSGSCWPTSATCATCGGTCR